MERAAFEASLLNEGYQVVTVTMAPNAVNPEHVHPFDARLLVAEGSMTVSREDGPTLTHQTGAVFEVPAGTRHSETASAAGVTYVAGRRTPARKVA